MGGRGGAAITKDWVTADGPKDGLPTRRAVARWSSRERGDESDARKHPNLFGPFFFSHQIISQDGFLFHR